MSLFGSVSFLLNNAAYNIPYDDYHHVYSPEPDLLSVIYTVPEEVGS